MSAAVASYDELLATLTPHGQQHLLQFWHQLTAEQQAELATQVRALDFLHLQRLFKAYADGDADIEDVATVEPMPADCSASMGDLDQAVIDQYWQIGLDAVSKGEVGAIVLAGGQATRLGADRPKGTLSLGLIRQADSLLDLQAQQLVKLQSLADTKYPDRPPAKIQWYIMTSKGTLKDTQDHITDKVLPASGLSADQVHFFVQGELPAFTKEGKLILAEKHKIFMAPDGNGSLYGGIAPLLPAMASAGVQYLHVYCVDNVLCRVADPHFIGYCVAKGADCANKVVEKTDPHEAVGVVCRVGGVPQVVEYSGRTSELLSTMRDANAPDKLAFRAGNIANHFFTRAFLQHVCDPEWEKKNSSLLMPYHPAVKKVPFVDDTGAIVKPDKPNGIKLEQFVFDVFKYSK